MKGITIVIILFQTCLLIGQNYSVGDTLNVVATEGLNLRSSPTISGTKIGKLENGSKAIILKLDSLSAETISTFKGNWILIKTLEEDSGYVFDAYISSFPVLQKIEMFGEVFSEANKIKEVEENPQLLYQYSIEAFKKNYCEFEYNRGSDGEGAYGMKIYELEKNHKLILHQYWESSSTELELSNARISEVYYLIVNLLKFYPNEFYIINENDIFNPQHSYYPCAVETSNKFCFIKIIKKTDNKISIVFFNQGT